LTTLLWGQNLSCTIIAEKSIIKKGQAPKITVEIKNNTDSTILLVKTLDASNMQWRFPYVYFRIERLGDKSYKMEDFERCGNFDEIDSADFVEVKRGETFDPYKNQSQVYADHRVSNPCNYAKKGKYKITFYYSTNQQDFKQWMGDRYAGQVRKWFDGKTGKIKPEKEAEYNRLLELFKYVPKIDLVSNELIIEVK